MKIRSRAPLRIGLAGGGTDIEAYSNVYGGAVLNATISMYAYCTITPRFDGKIKFVAHDNHNTLECDAVSSFPITDNNLILHKGVYNRIIKDFNDGKPLSFTMSTCNDAPIGSGLGTSSTMVVAIIEAFSKWLNLDLTEEQKAMLAYDIERKDLRLAGGKQDQFSAVYGGINLMEFNPDGSSTITKLNSNEQAVSELECSLVLYYGGKSRSSSDIIKEQIKNTTDKKDDAILAMHNIKKFAYKMKDAIDKCDILSFAKILQQNWENKKKTSSIITNQQLERTINYAFHHGAEAVKVSGAGGGGFLLFYVAPENRQLLLDSFSTLNGNAYPVNFTFSGVESWILD